MTHPTLGKIRRRQLKLWILFAVLYFSYLVFWALWRPPGMSPDEASHLNRCLVLTEYPLICPTTHPLIPSERSNPLVDHPLLTRMVLRPEVQLATEEVVALKSVTWEDPGRWVPVYTYHQTNPPLYQWAVHPLASTLTRLLDLSPWESFMTYRIVTAFWSSLLWTTALASVQMAFPFGGWMALAATLAFNPTAVFVSSAVNNDALSIPLGICLVALVISGIRGRIGPLLPSLVFGALAATKALCLPLGLAVCLASFTTCLLTRGPLSRRCRDMGILSGLWVVAALALFHAHVPVYLRESGSDETLAEYLHRFFPHLKWLFCHYWGWLGWQDYAMPMWSYRMIGLLMALCAAFGIRRFLRPSRWSLWFLGILLIMFTLLLHAGEYRALHISGYMLSGRYWLPISLALNILFLNQRRWVHGLTILMMVAINAYFIVATQERYYL